MGVGGGMGVGGQMGSTGKGTMADAIGGAMASSGEGAPADTRTCASDSYRIELLAARVAACADRAEAALAELAWLELQSWQSPAGRAYRTALGLHAGSLRRNRDAFRDAAAIVLRHAREVTLSPGPAGY